MLLIHAANLSHLWRPDGHSNSWQYWKYLNSPTRASAQRPIRVERVTRVTRTLIDDMLETMYAAPGIGLAATQVNIHQRLLVMDVSEDKTSANGVSQPELSVLDRSWMNMMKAACLFPGFMKRLVAPKK